MNHRSLLVVGAFTLCTLLAAGAQDSDRAKAERYIIDCEREWAETAISGDTTKADVFIADDFVGVAPGGSFYDKGLELKRIRESKGSFVWTHLNEVKVRFFGD